MEFNNNTNPPLKKFKTLIDPLQLLQVIQSITLILIQLCSSYSKRPVIHYFNHCAQIWAYTWMTIGRPPKPSQYKTKDIEFPLMKTWETRLKGPKGLTEVKIVRQQLNNLAIDEVITIICFIPQPHCMIHYVILFFLLFK